MEIPIRAARLPKDADGLARVYMSSAEHHAALDPDRYHVPSLAAVAWRHREPGPGGEQILAAYGDGGGRVIGFAAVTMLPPPGPESMLADVPTATVDVAVLRSSTAGESAATCSRQPRRRPPAPARGDCNSTRTTRTTERCACTATSDTSRWVCC